MSSQPPPTACLQALRSVTPRGRCLVAAGLACVASGVVVGAADLVRAGALVVVLPVLAVLAHARRRNRISCARSVLPAAVRPGDACTVTVAVSNHTRRATPSLAVAEEVAPALGVPPGFVLDPIQPGATRYLRYELGPRRRGVHRLGPLTYDSADPFGCSSRRVRLDDAAYLTVTPVVVPLPTITPPGVSPDGDERTSVVPAAGADDIAVREYRMGDDVRRVHWRATARTGELMVRREEHERRPPATLILDSRRHAFALGPGEPGSPAFEWAVSAAASVGAHLLAADRPIRLVHVDGRSHLLRTCQSTAALLVELARLAPADTSTLTAAAAAARPSGWVVAVLGQISDADVACLCGLRGGGGRQVKMAVLAAGADSPRPHPDALRRLRQAGWTVAWGTPGTPLAPLWVRLASGDPSRGGRQPPETGAEGAFAATSAFQATPASPATSAFQATPASPATSPFPASPGSRGTGWPGGGASTPAGPHRAGSPGGH